MRPHPSFAGWVIPREFALNGFMLNALGVDDADRDFAAIMESAADIKAANPTMRWPEGLTHEENLIDLAWHQKEFQLRRSFAWVIEDASGEYLGCLYVYPSISGEKAADVRWWWRTGASVDPTGFRAQLMAWLSGDGWPELEYRLR